MKDTMTLPDNLQSVIRKAQAGDRAAFDALVEKHRKGLERLIRSRLAGGGLGLGESVGVQEKRGSGAHDDEAALVGRLGMDAEHEASLAQPSDLPLSQEEAGRVSGVAVDDSAVEVHLGQEQRHELGGETAPVDDLIESRHRSGQLVLASETHA